MSTPPTAAPLTAVPLTAVVPTAALATAAVATAAPATAPPASGGTVAPGLGAAAGAEVVGPQHAARGPAAGLAPVRPPSPGARTRTLAVDDRRVLAAWAASCAEQALPLFECRAPGDPRPREALEGLRRFACGELRVGPLRDLAVRAHAAAREVDDPAAVAAARAAGHAAAVAHMAAHALGAPAYAARAAGLAAPGDPAAAAGVVDWADRHAGEAVRSVLRRLPARDALGGALGPLVAELQARLTGRRAGLA